jgi:hypothetical protein
MLNRHIPVPKKAKQPDRGKFTNWHATKNKVHLQQKIPIYCTAPKDYLCEILPEAGRTFSEYFYITGSLRCSFGAVLKHHRHCQMS